MENRRRQRLDNYRRPQNRVPRPPRGNRQPTVPSWEKEFCKKVGLLDWETLLQMKKFIHFYDKVMNWNDSASEEAFHNAKKRFSAEINGLSCEIPYPDPDLYIDKINWDSEINHPKQPTSVNTEENWGNYSNNGNGAPNAWAGYYYNNGWQFGDYGSGYMPWGGGWYNYDSGWSSYYADNRYFNNVGSDIEDKIDGRYLSGDYCTSRDQGNGRYWVRGENF